MSCFLCATNLMCLKTEKEKKLVVPQLSNTFDSRFELHETVFNKTHVIVKTYLRNESLLFCLINAF